MSELVSYLFIYLDIITFIQQGLIKLAMKAFLILPNISIKDEKFHRITVSTKI